MPFDKSKYPADWDQIRQQILNRAGHRCEQCGVPNHVWVVRNEAGEHWPSEGRSSRDNLLRSIKYEGGVDGGCGMKPIRIVLTIAHTDNPDPMDCRPENLKALCQRDHLRLDAKMHGINAAVTRSKNKRKQIEQAGQLTLGIEVTQ